jgi:TIR domain
MSVFISYSHKDDDFVHRLATRMVENNIKVWKDDMKISAGDTFMNKIKAGIRGASCFCVVLSENSVSSKWVKEELNEALMHETQVKGIVVLPILLDDCKVPQALDNRIFVDFRRDFDLGLRQILGVVEQRYNVGDAGRIGTDSRYYLDYGIEQRSIDGKYFMQVDVISCDNEERFTILSQFYFHGNEHATREYLELKEGESLRDYVLKACAQEFAVNPARITLNAKDPKRVQFFIQDGDGLARFDVEVRIKWLGHASRATLLFNVGALFGQLCENCGVRINEE